MSMVEDILEHHGIKGMRWGVRRTRSQIDADSADVTVKKATQAKIATNKTLDVLSNQELQNLNTRLQLEQTYSQLVAKDSERNRTALQKGGKWAGKFVGDVANQQAKNFANALLKAQIEAKAGEVIKKKK